jgi:hypothetical protein
MYCPACFGRTLSLKKHGVIHTVINGKKMDTGRFLFNDLKDTKEDRLRELKKKIEDFFKWYSSFQNKEPIQSFGLYSSDFVCSNDCKIPINSRISIIGLIFKAEDVKKVIEGLAEKYGMETNLDIDQQQ